MKVTSSVGEYVRREAYYYMTNGWVPDIYLHTFVHVNRCALNEVAKIIRSEEDKGYLVNASPLRFSEFHAVLSYKMTPAVPADSEFQKKIGEAGAHLRNIITR
jgi:hypothetical protein